MPDLTARLLQEALYMHAGHACSVVLSVLCMVHAPATSPNRRLPGFALLGLAQVVF